MAEKFDPKIPCPYVGVFDEESLYFSGISGFICSDILPLLHFHRISITDTDAELANHAGKELIVGKDNSIDPDVFLNICQYKLDLVICG